MNLFEFFCSELQQTFLVIFWGAKLIIDQKFFALFSKTPHPLSNTSCEIFHFLCKAIYQIGGGGAIFSGWCSSGSSRVENEFLCTDELIINMQIIYHYIAGPKYVQKLLSYEKKKFIFSLVWPEYPHLRLVILLC